MFAREAQFKASQRIRLQCMCVLLLSAAALQYSSASQRGLRGVASYSSSGLETSFVTTVAPICCAGMLTQHKVQLDLREKNPNMVRPPANPYVVGSQQLQARLTCTAACPVCAFIPQTHARSVASHPHTSCMLMMQHSDEDLYAAAAMRAAEAATCRRSEVLMQV
jgi:hypothetical protein